MNKNWSLPPAKERPPENKPTSVYRMFRDFCKVYAHDKPVDKQLRMFIKRYPVMKDYEEHLLNKVREHRGSAGLT